MATTTTLTLEGLQIHDIPTFYNEINRIFMAGKDWRLGESLDALDDMLRGGYGATEGFDSVVLRWRYMERCRNVLGIDATRVWLSNKLATPETYARTRIQAQLDALNCGGPTYFDVILEIIDSHRRIRLVPD